jgi:acetyl/propionyl-CoA carboxylase alpha subunit
VRGAGLTGIGGLLMQHTFIIAEVEHEGWLSRRGDDYVLHIGEKVVPIALANAEGGGQLLSLDSEITRVLIAPDGDFVHVHLDGMTFTVRYVDPVQRYGGHAGGSADDIAEAPMPGVVIAVHVKEGQSVTAGDTLMVIESMKLETAIRAWRNGVIAAVHVGVGQTFQRGAPLLALAPE